MKKYMIGNLIALIGTFSLSAPAAEVLNCRLEINKDSVPAGYSFKSVGPAVSVIPNDSEKSYIEFDYMLLGHAETLRLHYSIENKDKMEVRPFTGKLDEFRSIVVKPICSPESIDYLIVHTGASNLAVKERAFTTEQWAERTQNRTLEVMSGSLDSILEHTCIFGSMNRAYESLKQSPLFSKRETLTLDPSGTKMYFKLDQQTGCRSYYDDEYCEDPIIEVNGATREIRACNTNRS